MKWFKVYGSAMVSSRGMGPRLRYCPSHRRYEMNPPGRMLCSLAWRDLYALEREVELEQTNPLALIADVLQRLPQSETPTHYQEPRPRPVPQRSGTINV